jgi:hypothetical protein
METNWEIPLFTVGKIELNEMYTYIVYVKVFNRIMFVGDYKICLFSFFMSPCAMAYARSQLDDSNIVFNLSCTCLPLNRWLVRTAYGINGDTMEDVVTSVLCFPCAVNQMLHTTIARGNPSTDGGMLQNFERWEVPLTKVDIASQLPSNISYLLFLYLNRIIFQFHSRFLPEMRRMGSALIICTL